MPEGITLEKLIEARRLLEANDAKIEYMAIVVDGETVVVKVNQGNPDTDARVIEAFHGS